MNLPLWIRRFIAPQTGMRLADATRAFLDTIAEAQLRAAAAETGPELPKLIRHAQKLLDIIEDETLKRDPIAAADLFASAARMRTTLNEVNESVSGAERKAI